MAKKKEVIPAGYLALLEELKGRIAAARTRTVVSVCRELIALHWEIGKAIVAKQQAEGWGKSVVDRLADDLRKAFPRVSGFSRQNLWYMRQFYHAWTEGARNLQQPVGDLDGHKLPDAVAGLPWGHNLILLSKLEEPRTRLWYARKATENGWSRAVLTSQIDSRLHERQGGAVTNFARTLPAPDSDLAGQLLKAPYVFDFLTVADDARERDLEEGLIAHVRRFLLELGVGFAFVGSQVPLEVGGDDFAIDLLFYHYKLHCFFVIDLKMEEFAPEHAGKMNFYLSAVDDRLRDKAVDGPTLGLILCRRKNKVVAEYALRDMAKPIGVAGWETRLVESLPQELEGALPTVEMVEEEIERIGAGKGRSTS